MEETRKTAHLYFSENNKAKTFYLRTAVARPSQRKTAEGKPTVVFICNELELAKSNVYNSPQMSLNCSILDKAFSIPQHVFLAGDFHAKTVAMCFERNHNTALQTSSMRNLFQYILDYEFQTFCDSAERVKEEFRTSETKRRCHAREKGYKYSSLLNLKHST